MWLGVNWPWPPPRRADVVSILVLTLAAIAVIAAIFVLNKSPRSDRMTNWGFGPDWQCTHPGKGDPVCIKKPPTNSVPSN
jgi:hypothetical protein